MFNWLEGGSVKFGICFVGFCVIVGVVSSVRGVS